MTYREAVTQGLTQSDPAAAYRYSHCREEGFGWWYHCPNNDAHYAAYVPAFCMLRICPDCGSYLAHLIQDKYRPVIELEAKKNAGSIESTKYPEYRAGFLRFLTLTVSTELQANIGTACRDLLDKVRDFYRQVWGEEAGAGAIANLEVGPHGHKLHCHLIVQGKWRDKDKLSKRWEKMTGGDMIVDISLITADKAVKEGLKYITKTAELNPQQLVDLHNALKGTRRIRSWGCFYNAVVDETEEEVRETECPECAAKLRYTGELAFEQWRTENIARRIQVEMERLARSRRSLESLLDLTDTNKFFGLAPPTGQISLFGGKPATLDDLLDDALPVGKGRKR